MVNVVWVSGLLSTLSGVRATLRAVVSSSGDALLLQAGIGESLAGLILALAAISVVWMEIAIGLRRATRQELVARGSTPVNAGAATATAPPGL